MKTMIALLLCLFLSGCYTEGWEVRKGQEICLNRGGVFRIRVFALGKSEVYCNDGYIFSIEPPKGNSNE